jgi:segregation and condensation protein B
MEENPKPTQPTSTDPSGGEAPQGEGQSETAAERPTESLSEKQTDALAETHAAPSEAPTPDGGGPITVDELLKTGDGQEPDAECPAADLNRAAAILESLLLVSTEPLPLDKARQLLGNLTRVQIREVQGILLSKYPPESSGILVEEVARGLQLRTNPANQEHIRKLYDIKPPRFSRAALETLSIIAYKQPLTRQEIEQIRGVDCAGALKTLMERRLVRVMGKKDVPGKPFLFGTTREFMEVFSIGSLSDLPSMREIEEFLASSTATPVEAGRPGVSVPVIPDSGIEQGGDELAASLEEAGPGGEESVLAEGAIPGDVSEADLSDAASKEAGEPPDAD